MPNIPNASVVQNLIINIIGTDQFTTLMPLFKLINDNGGNVVTSRVSALGEHFSGYLLIDGRWDAITKIEKALGSIEQNLKLKIINQRTSPLDYGVDEQPAASSATDKPSSVEYIPYKISINNLDEPGLLEKITEFFVLQEILIQDLCTTSYTAEYGAEMVQVEVKIKVPSDIHIPSLREQFEILCYNENLDASLMPCKTI